MKGWQPSCVLHICVVDGCWRHRVSISRRQLSRSCTHREACFTSEGAIGCKIPAAHTNNARGRSVATGPVVVASQSEVEEELRCDVARLGCATLRAIQPILERPPQVLRKFNGQYKPADEAAVGIVRDIRIGVEELEATEQRQRRLRKRILDRKSVV